MQQNYLLLPVGHQDMVQRFQTAQKNLKHMVHQKICVTRNFCISASIWARNLILSLLTPSNSPVSDLSVM